MALILPQLDRTYDWFSLVEGVDAYLRLLRKNGVPDSAISPVLVGLDDVDVWVGEVLNGGHSQYVANKAGAALQNLRRALVTVQACGMQGWVGILRSVIDWVRDNPGQSTLMTGFAGGVSKKLQLLDRTFAATLERDKASFIAAFMGLPGVRLVPGEAIEVTVREEAERQRAISPRVQKFIVREAVVACRAFFDDASAVALALACQTANLVLREVEKPLPLGPDRDVTFSLMLVMEGLPGTGGVWQVMDRKGLRLQTAFPPARGGVLAEVTWPEVQLAQDMAQEMRLSEMAGLCWAKTGRAFHLHWARLRVLPGPLWSRSRGGIGLGTKDWAVTANKQNLEFHDTLKDIHQRLNTQQLNTLLEEAGL